jgi:hypothetical protein
MESFDEDIIKHANKLEGLVQIVNVAGCAEVLEESTRVVRLLGGTVIGVEGIWPIVSHSYEGKHSDPDNFITPKHKLNDCKSECERLGIHYIEMDEYAYCGKQMNAAFDYAKENDIDIQILWGIDGDETIDPSNVGQLIDEIVAANLAGHQYMYFCRRQEISPGWKDLELNNFNRQGLFWGATATLKRSEAHNGHRNLETSVEIGDEALCLIPTLHLHNFRLNACCRVKDNIWRGGNLEFDLSEIDDLIEETPYIKYLKDKYSFQCIDIPGETTYIGSEFMKESDCNEEDQERRRSSP